MPEPSDASLAIAAALVVLGDAKANAAYRLGYYNGAEMVMRMVEERFSCEHESEAMSTADDEQGGAQQPQPRAWLIRSEWRGRNVRPLPSEWATLDRKEADRYAADPPDYTVTPLYAGASPETKIPEALDRLAHLVNAYCNAAVNDAAAAGRLFDQMRDAASEILAGRVISPGEKEREYARTLVGREVTPAAGRSRRGRAPGADVAHQSKEGG